METSRPPDLERRLNLTTQPEHASPPASRCIRLDRNELWHLSSRVALPNRLRQEESV